MYVCGNTPPFVTQHYFSCHKFVKSMYLEFSDIKFPGSNRMFQNASLLRTQTHEKNEYKKQIISWIDVRFSDFELWV
jgi:hypothetical protein